MKTYYSKYRKKNKSRGFSLIEVLAAIMIIGMLATAATIGITAQLRKARIRTTQANISTLQTAIQSFNLECGFWPASLEEIISEPTSRSCRGFPPEGFLGKKELPKDGWSNEFNYARPGTHNPSSFDLWSNGEDGEEGTSDDVTNWKSETSEG